jgi:hypothetical protein
LALGFGFRGSWRLEICGGTRDWKFEWNSLAQYEIENEQPKYEGRHTYYLQLLGFILRFTGLQKVYFTWSMLVMGTLYPGFDDMEECRETLQAFFDKHEDAFSSGKAPEVKVRRWKARAGVFVCSNRDVEEVLKKPE